MALPPANSVHETLRTTWPSSATCAPLRRAPSETLLPKWEKLVPAASAFALRSTISAPTCLSTPLERSCAVMAKRISGVMGLLPGREPQIGGEQGQFLRGH